MMVHGWKTAAAAALAVWASAAGAKTVVATGDRNWLLEKAAELAGLDIKFKPLDGGGWGDGTAYEKADVAVLTGGWNEYTFAPVAARRALVKFAASGKGVFLASFRCGPVRNGATALFPEIGTTYAAHPLSPWVRPVGESAIAKAFGGETLNFGGFDCFGLKLGPDASPFAECSGETVGVSGPCGLGRAVLFGGFVHGEGAELRDMEKSCAVVAEIFRYLSSGPEATEAERKAAADRALADYDRYCEVLRLTLDDNGPGATQGVIPAARDAALIPIESRQLRLEHYARTLDDASLAAECREAAGKTKSVVSEIRSAAEAEISRIMSGTGGSGRSAKGADWRGMFGKIAGRADIATLDALLAKCRTKAREERTAHVAAEHAQDLPTIPSLVSLLSSTDSVARLDAATELGRIGEAAPEVVAALVKALDDTDDRVAVQAAISLAWMQAKGAVDALIAKVSDDKCEEHVRRRAAQALGQIGDRRAIPALMPLLASRDRWLRENAILSLGYLKASEAVPTLLRYARGEGIPEHDGRFTRHEEGMERVTCECAIVALGDIGDKSAAPVLESMKDEGLSGRWSSKWSVWNAKMKPDGFIFSRCGLGMERLARIAMGKIDGGGRSGCGIRQPGDLSSRRYFYALAKGDNALVGRLYWTLPQHPSFKDRETHGLMLPYLLDAGATGFLDGWERDWGTGEDAIIDVIRECDELGLVAVEHTASSAGTDLCDILKGSMDAEFDIVGDVPLFRGGWSEEWWPALKSTGVDLETWLKRRYGEGYKTVLGLTPEQDPLSREMWDDDNSDEGADPDKYAPGANSGALRVAALEKAGEDLEERWREAQDWLSCRRKAFCLTYSVTDSMMHFAVGGQKAQERIGVFGPESYQACGRGSVFKIEYSRNGLARPVLTEFYNMYSPSPEHDLRGFYENAIRAKCFYPFGLNQISPFFSAFTTWGWAKHRWGEFRKVYRHVRDNRDLYSVSPSETKVAVVLSERSEAAFMCKNYTRAVQQSSVVQRGCAVYAALSMSHIYADVLHIDVADSARLAKYKVLFLVNAKILTAREQALLKEWVAGGGTLVCDGAVSLFDAVDLKRLGDYGIADLLGVRYRDTGFAPTRDVWAYGHVDGGNRPYRVRQGLDNPWRFCQFVYRDNKPTDCIAVAREGSGKGYAGGSVEYDASLGIDKVELAGAKAVQSFADGSPAMTVNSYGKGRVYFFAANAPSLGYVASQYESTPNRYYFWPGVRETYERLAREGLARAGAEQAVDLAGAPAELDMVIYSQDGGSRLVVHLLDRDESRDSLSGVSLRINGRRPVKAVYRPGLSGTRTALPPDGRTVALGRFSVYDMIVVDFE